MNFENILIKKENGIVTIIINRPDKLNALTKKTVQEIGLAVKNSIIDKEIDAMIITGSGTKSFVAGADISEFITLSIKEGEILAQAGHDVFLSIEQSPKPIIAAINGFALGGGCELAMACHLRVAAENAKFGQPEVNLGLIPGYGGTQRLIQYLGKTKATELLMTADMISAEDALKLGLVNYAVPQDQLMNKCTELLQKIRSKSPLAIAGIINCVNAYYKHDVNGFAKEVEEFGKCFGTNDFKEGTTAFIEKRKPVFK